jgi:hypothetical protein
VSDTKDPNADRINEELGRFLERPRAVPTEYAATAELATQLVNYLGVRACIHSCEGIRAALGTAYDAGRRKEREAIANLVEGRADDFIAIGQAGAFRRLAAAIRARGEGGAGL